MKSLNSSRKIVLKKAKKLLHQNFQLLFQKFICNCQLNSSAWLRHTAEFIVGHEHIFLRHGWIYVFSKTFLSIFSRKLIHRMPHAVPWENLGNTVYSTVAPFTNMV